MVMKSSFKWSDLADMAGGFLIGSNVELTGLFQVDSRKLSHGDVFIAIPGSVSDGHDFLKSAVASGASGAVVEKKWFDKKNVNFPQNFRLLVVSDSEEFLIKAANRRLDLCSPGEVIAITGSVGKTTTREMIYTVLDGSYRVHRARSSHNTRIGCAMTILEMPSDTEILILEMGTNHPGEIAEMVGFFPETIAVLTEIFPAHLEGLKNVEGVLSAKLEILESRKLNKIIYNSDSSLLSNALSSLVSNRLEHTFVSVGQTGQYRFSFPSLTWEDGFLLKFIATHKDFNFKFKSLLSGLHYCPLICLAWAVAVELGIDPEVALKKLTQFRSFNGRGNVVRSKNGVLLIDETYNANPGSMSAALNALKEVEKSFSGQIIIILGDMRELGDSEIEAHRKILDSLSDMDSVFLYGEKWLPVSGDLPVFKSQNELLEKVKRIISPGDLVLLKGSRSNGLEKILEELVLL